MSRVPCASFGLGSKIVCSIDEKGRLIKRFPDEISSADVGSVSNMLRTCKFMFSFENVLCQMFYIVAPRVDGHMLVSKIKPCMS